MNVTVLWERGDQVFSDRKYSRGHRWIFDGGIEVPASSSPDVVPLPLSVAEAVDPEEAFVASLSSCHMLWFLILAAKKGFVIDSYRDEPEGTLSKNAEGRQAITKMVLHPEVVFNGTAPSREEMWALHEKSHDLCYIAASVTAEVLIEPKWTD